MPAEFRPGAEGAVRYNDPVPVAVPVTALGEAVATVVAATAEANGRVAPEADGRLYAVAGELASLMVGDETPPYEVIEFALAHHGIVEPSPHLLVVRTNTDDADAVATELGAKLPRVVVGNRFTRLGVGSARADDGTTTIVLALQESSLELGPVERKVASGGSVALRGKVLHPYADPRVYVTGTDGNVTSVALARAKDGVFRTDVRCAADGRIKVEIVAYNGTDPNVLANFPVWCGEDPPTRVAIDRSDVLEGPVSDAAAAERRIFDLVNEDRRKSGLPPLVWDDRAAAIARAHSADMHDNGFVAHVSPTTGSASDRAKAAGLVTPLVLENIARAYSPREAQEGLMNSPGHRANVLSTEATHVGVGIALGSEVSGLRELYVTQMFFRVPPKVDKKVALGRVRQAVDDGRASVRGRTLERDGELDSIAQEYADGLVEGELTRPALSKRAAERIDKLGYRFGAVVSVVQIVGDPEQAEEIGKMLDADIRFIGVGVAQGKDDTIGDGAIFVVVLGAKLR
jgi:uncharacterized protein YkwD